MSVQGREFQFAKGDSGRSGAPGGPRRLECRLHIHQRSLGMRDQRRPDDCCVAVTVHWGRVDHRPQPLRCRPSPLTSNFGFGHIVAVRTPAANVRTRCLWKALHKHRFLPVARPSANGSSQPRLCENTRPMVPTGQLARF
jgi:hypothetical protein